MTNSRQLRSVLPAAAVVVAALLAAFAQFTLPRMEKLGVLRAECEVLSERIDESGPASSLRVLPEARDVVQFVKHVQAVNAVIAEPSKAYDHLVDLARRNGLQVESISPSRAEKESGRFDQFGWTMVAVGKFAAIVEFVDALNSAEGLHRIASMRVTPAMGADSTILTLNVNVEFVRVLVPELLLSGNGGGGSGAPREVSR